MSINYYRTTLFVLLLFVISAIVIQSDFSPIGHFSNDLYQLQANSLKEFRFNLGMPLDKLVILDTTVHQNQIYMTWGILPAITYAIFDVLTFGGPFPKSILYILHLVLLLVAIWKLIKLSNVDEVTKSIIFFSIGLSPLIGHYYTGDISALKINGLYSLCYLMWAIFFQIKSHSHFAQSFYLFTSLTKFNYLPHIIVLNLFHFIKSKKIKILFWSISIIMACLAINYLKFGDFFYWGERYGKFHGEWFPHYKMLFLDFWSPSKFVMTLVDIPKAFFQTQNDRFYEASHVNSFITYKDSITPFLMILVTYLSRKEKSLQQNPLKFFLISLFIFTFFIEKTLSVRAMAPFFLIIMIFLVLSTKKVRPKVIKSTLIPLAVISLAQKNFASNNIYPSPRLFIKDEISAVDGKWWKPNYRCLDIQKMQPDGLIQKAFPGIERNCETKKAFSIVIDKTSQSCTGKIKIENVNCEQLLVFSNGTQNPVVGGQSACAFKFKDSSFGAYFLYFIISDPHLSAEDYSLRPKFSSLTTDCSSN